MQTLVLAVPKYNALHQAVLSVLSFWNLHEHLQEAYRKKGPQMGSKAPQRWQVHNHLLRPKYFQVSKPEENEQE